MPLTASSRTNSVRARRRPLATLALVAAAALAVGCSEDLESGAACPALCPDQNVRVVDTTLDAAVALDTSLAGYPALGTEPYLLLAARGDTLDMRAVVRFDSLLERYTGGSVAGDTGIKITQIDSSYIIIDLDTAASLFPAAPITVEAYDVDTTAADTATDVLVGLFRPDRFLGSVTRAPADTTDSLRVPLDSATIRGKFTNRQRIRIGLRVVAPAPTELRVYAVEGASTSHPPPHLRYYPSPDTAVHPSTTPYSKTPADDPIAARELFDYTVVATAPNASGPDVLGVGGLPARRAYLRFDIPPAILDSATIVRATLLLTQRPAGGAAALDTFAVFPQVVTAGVAVTDVARALRFLGPAPGALDPLALDSLRVVPADSGVRSFEMLHVLQDWSFRPDTLAPRAIALRSSLEGSIPQQAAFFSTEAPPEVRPKLRISYVPRVPFGLP